jgi:TonB-linked SusC/RagA family outer membrane protein
MRLALKELKSCSMMRIMAVFLLLSVMPTLLLAQNRKISGTVTDENGKPVPEVSITIKNKSTGTKTDDAGRFSIDAQTGQTLVINSINHEIIELMVGESSMVNASLKTKVNNLNDVVVVGYATQKKVNMTGSVATISAKQIEDRPVTNLSSSLAGLSSGVYVRQGSGQPGSDGASILIRGTGTLSSNAPLVVIDGIIGSMDAVNPLDVETISVLKDAASASIYGSLAANGVILITTKKGQRNKTTVTYNGIFSTTNPMNMPKYNSNYSRHMQMINEGTTNIGQPSIFAASTIRAWDSTSLIPDQLNAIGVPNRIAYPNTDWGDALFDNKVVQNHNISINGGSDKVNYLLSVGYLDNKGVMQNTGTKRYQIRANLDARVAKWLTMGTQTFASTQTYDMGNTASAFNFLGQTTPGVVPTYNGRYGFPHAQEESSTANAILAFLNNTDGSNVQSRFNTTLYAIINLYKGLTLESRFNYQIRFGEYNSHSVPQERWNFATNEVKTFPGDPSTFSTYYSFDKATQTTIDNVLRYSTKIGSDHDISALAGYNQMYSNSYNFNASKQGLIDYSITTLGSALLPTTTNGGESDYAMRSWFGRVNYAFRNKYLLEANLRYDGSSRFSPSTRWGLFPSVSAGWRIIDEKFMEGTKSWLSNLKIRGSWGKLGNNASGVYDWQSTYATRLYSFNNVQSSGLAVGRIANPELQWETTTTTNFGLDGAVLNNKLFFEFDLYQRLTDGILSTVPVPLTVGTASSPIVNAAEVKNNGYEITLGYRGKSGEFNYRISGNYAYNTNEVTKYKGQLVEGYVTDATGAQVYQSNIGLVSAGGTNRILEGKKINEFRIYEVYKGSGTYNNADGTVNINGGPRDGMIRTPEDLAWAQAMITAGYRLLPSNAIRNNAIYYGDLIYADLNGDGQYGNSFDQKFTGTSTLPKYIFGFNAEFSWKSFDLSMIWAGAAGFQYYWNDTYINSTVRNGFAFSNTVLDNHYFYNPLDAKDPRNNINAKYTRLKSSDPQNTALASDWWMQNGSWIKLKNLQIGYNIPEKLAKKMLMSRARVYVSGENLLMITKYPGLDPEIGAGIGYPTMRQYALGINVNF